MTTPNDKLNRNRQHETITFRLEHHIVQELREAQQKIESLDELVNQILKTYVKWYKPSRRAGNTDFSKVLVSRMHDVLTDEQIAKIAHEYVNKVKR